MAKNSNKQAARSDTAQPSKAKQKDKEYLEYQRYIRSKDFKVVREAVLERDGHRCRCCGRTADEAPLNCHHSTYAHLYDEMNHLDDMITLCKYCHCGVHRVPSNYQRFNRKKRRGIIEIPLH